MKPNELIKKFLEKMTDELEKLVSSNIFQEDLPTGFLTEVIENVLKGMLKEEGGILLLTEDAVIKAMGITRAIGVATLFVERMKQKIHTLEKEKDAGNELGKRLFEKLMEGIK